MKNIGLKILFLSLALSLFLGNAKAQMQVLEFPFHKEGRFMVDAKGRVVMFHGVNMVNKLPPFTPLAQGFGEADAKIMEDAGWNVVRLGVLHSGVEPSPGKYDDDYIEQIAKSVDLLGRHGIYTLLDFHQDLYGPVFQGDGLAPWATQTEGLPLTPDYGFPDNYFKMPALQKAFDHFWDNCPGPEKVGLQDRFVASWEHVAKRFADHPWVMGYDLFNEPFPGTSWKKCTFAAGCVNFDPVLGAFMEKTAKAIAAVDSQHLIFNEPPVLFGLGIPTLMLSMKGPRMGFSFHDYFPKDFSTPIRNALEHFHRTGDALFMTEFGASVDPAPVVKVVELADANMIPWIYWAYANKTPFKIITPGLPSTPEEQGIVLDLSKPRKGANLNGAMLKSLSRPYPVAVAGIPSSFSYDPPTGIFRLSYTKPDWKLKSEETVIVLPKSAYPHGYRVEVTGAQVLSPPNAKYLRILRKGDVESVTVSVAPGK